jgi:outer membrane lipoprotein-sorting protein
VSKRRAVKPGEVFPARTSTRQELIEAFNQQAHAVRSINAGVELQPVTGSAYSGVIEEYREVAGFLLAQRPASVRIIGQAPVVAKNVFDMGSDGETFRIFIPSKNKFIIGSAASSGTSGRPIENLRPQHLLDALFWSELPEAAPVLFEEFDLPPHRYYVLTALRLSSSGEGKDLEIARKVWFDRANLLVARLQIFGSGGRRVSDIRYADWQTVAGIQFPGEIILERPQEDYSLTLRITKLALNEPIAADRFRLEQPPGTELVRVGEGQAGAGK